MGLVCWKLFLNAFIEYDFFFLLICNLRLARRLTFSKCFYVWYVIVATEDRTSAIRILHYIDKKFYG